MQIVKQNLRLDGTRDGAGVFMREYSAHTHTYIQCSVGVFSSTSWEI